MKKLRSRIMTSAFALLWGWVGSKSTPTRQRRCLTDARMRTAFCCHSSIQPTLQQKQQQGGSACTVHAGSAAAKGQVHARTAAADWQLREVGAAAGAERYVLRVRMACVRLLRACFRRWRALGDLHETFEPNRNQAQLRSSAQPQRPRRSRVSVPFLFLC